MRHFAGRKSRWNERSPNRSRGYAVNADAFFRERLGQRAGEGDNCAFGGRVVEEMRTASISRNTGRVDDSGTLLEVSESCFCKIELSEDVSAKGALKLPVSDFLEVFLGMLLGSVVDEDGF